MPILDKIYETQLWKSIFRHPMPTDRRNRVVVMLTNFFLHLHPVSVRKQGISLSYTWCMGGTTFFLFIVETVTGVLLDVLLPAHSGARLQRYPGPTRCDHAGHPQGVTPVGSARDGDHRLAPYVSRVLDRQLQAASGIQLGNRRPAPRADSFVVVHRLFAPWDQLAIWAITVGSNMARATPGLGVEGPGASLFKVNGVSLITSGSDAKFALLGGRSVGEMTLNRFYVLHCVAIPLAAALLIMIHFWRVRKDGGISGPL